MGADGHSDCIVVREILDRVGDKWSVLVIALLGERGHRFNELRARDRRHLAADAHADPAPARARRARVAHRARDRAAAGRLRAHTARASPCSSRSTALTHWAAEHGTDIAEARRRYKEADDRGRPDDGLRSSRAARRARVEERRDRAERAGRASESSPPGGRSGTSRARTARRTRAIATIAAAEPAALVAVEALGASGDLVLADERRDLVRGREPGLRPSGSSRR